VLLLFLRCCFCAVSLSVSFISDLSQKKREESERAGGGRGREEERKRGREGGRERPLLFDKAPASNEFGAELV
jgi:hypothetical protein